jgi:hypothetical protein
MMRDGEAVYTLAVLGYLATASARTADMPSIPPFLAFAEVFFRDIGIDFKAGARLVVQLNASVFEQLTVTEPSESFPNYLQHYEPVSPASVSILTHGLTRAPGNMRIHFTLVILTFLYSVAASALNESGQANAADGTDMASVLRKFLRCMATPSYNNKEIPSCPVPITAVFS